MRLLVKAIDALHTDVTKNTRGCFKRGDVIVAKPDGHVWGSSEGLPKFYQIDVTGAQVEDITAVLEPRRLPEFGRLQTVARDSGLSLSALPVGNQSQLTSTGRTTITRGQFIAAIKRKA